jgi:predicted permease
MSDFVQEFRLALRTLRRSPAFAIAALLTLGLGTGAATAIFTLLKQTVLDPLPYPAASRLVRLKSQVPGVAEGQEWQLAAGEYFYFARLARTIEAIAAFRSSGVNILSGGQARRAQTAVIGARALDVFGGRAARGRLFDSTEYLPGARDVVMLSAAFWRQEFGGRPDVVGQTIQLDEQAYEVIGVLEPGVELPLPDVHSDVWIPMRLNPAGPFYNNHVIPMVARLAPGATVDQARAELARLTARLPEVLPTVYSPDFMRNVRFATAVYPLRDAVLGGAARNLWILFGAVGLLLLIAYGNVANLFLVHVEGRRREIGIRAALGAPRAAVARQFLAESAILALGSGIVAVILASWGVDWVVLLAPSGLPRVDELHLDGVVVVFALALSSAVAIGLALVPVVQYRPGGSSAALAERGRTTTVGRERRRLRGGLVVAQVALALVLVTGAGLLLQSHRRLSRVSPGVDPQGVLTLQLYVMGPRYDTPVKMWQFYRQALENVRRVPGVRDAGVTTALPLLGYGCTVQGFEDERVMQRVRDSKGTLCADMVETSPGAFEALGVPLLAGRTFTTEDNDDPARGVVMVSKTFAERFWPGEDPIGKGVIPFNRKGGRPYRVIGVVGDVHQETLDDDPASAIYYPMVAIPSEATWWPQQVYLTVRTGFADPVTLLPAIRDAARAVDPAIPLANAEDMTTVVARSMTRLSITMTLLAIAAAMAVLLAAIGLYGVLAYSVAQRTSEIGVRLALGAAPAQMERYVVGGALRLAFVGVAAGLAVAVAVTRVLQSLLFGVSPTDPLSYLAAAGLLAAVAALAAWLPARRAARVDPMVALRSE